MLTAEEIDRYRQDGFLPARPVLSAAEVERFRQDCDRCCAVPVKLGGQREADIEKRLASNRVKPYLLYPWAAELVRHPRILDAVEALIGPDILVYHTTVFWKDAESETFLPWHQDGTYFGLEPFDHLTAWVALTPSVPENGCVRVLPGSQREGQLAHADLRQPNAMLSRGQTVVADIPQDAGVDLLLTPGDMTLHNTMTVHRSGPNRSAERRIGIGISYIPASVRHTGPTRLSATLVRGTNRYGHFDLEPAPTAELDAAALATHADSQARFWTASSAIPEMAKIH